MFETVGFKKTNDGKNNWYGLLNDYYFTCYVLENKGQFSYSVSTNYCEDGLVGKIVDFLETVKHEKENFIDNFSVANGEIKITFLGSDNTYEIEAILKDLSMLMKNLNLKNSCVHCKKTDNLFLYNYTNGISILCNDCGTELNNQLKSSQEAKGYYLLGFVGSLLGALAGSVLWVLLGLIGWVASIAGYTIAFFAFWGYEKLKGKMDKKGVWINIITIIIAFLFANYIGVYFIVRKEIGLSFIEFIINSGLFFGDKDFLLAVLMDLLLGCLFLFLGIKRTVSIYFTKAKKFYDSKIEKLDL